jgi:hypothetical protein
VSDWIIDVAGTVLDWRHDQQRRVLGTRNLNDVD